MKVDIRDDIGKAITQLNLTLAEVMPAGVRAMNRALTSVRAEAVRQLKPQYSGIKVSAIRARLNMIKASNSKPTAVLIFSPSRIQLYGNFSMHTFGKFGVRWGALPWRVETPDGEEISKSDLDRAFRNRLTKDGRPVVMIRVQSKRYPVAVLLAPGMARTAVEKQILEACKTVGYSSFASNFKHELSRVMGRPLQ